jgi:PIN domain nuclease of toxin-antitoxin system
MRPLLLDTGAILRLANEVMFRSTELPNLHRDPADRFIIATALMRSLPVVTTDRRFSQYGVTVIS